MSGSVIGRGYALDTQPLRYKTALNRDTQTPDFVQPPLPFDFGNDPNNININRNGVPGNTIFPSNYKDKTIRVVNIDLTNIFVNQLFELPGTMIFFSGQTGGDAAAVALRFDNLQNDAFSFPFDRAISGIPFRRFYINNATAQPGISIEITIINDGPFDRVGLNG